MEHQKGSLLAKQFKDFIGMWIASEFNFQKKKMEVWVETSITHRIIVMVLTRVGI